MSTSSDEQTEISSWKSMGRKAVPKSQIVKFMYWCVSSKEIECFLASYNDWNLEYRTGGGWTLHYNKTYRTLHVGDVIIAGYKHIVVLSNKEFVEKYQCL